MIPDPDYVDVSNMKDEDFEETLESDGQIDEEEVEAKNTRGKDLDWEELIHFENNQELEESEIRAEIKELMTKRKEWKTSWATNQNYSCKFQSKKGFKSCLRQIKVCFISTSHKVAVFSNMEEHCHQEDLDHVTAINYHWTGPQLDIIRNFIHFGGKNNNQIILEQLRMKGLCNGSGKYPSCAQVGTKKRNMKKASKKFENILTAPDLIRQFENKKDDPKYNYQDERVETGEEETKEPVTDFFLKNRSEKHTRTANVEDTGNKDHDDFMNNAAIEQEGDTQQYINNGLNHEITIKNDSNFKHESAKINIWCTTCNDDVLDQIKATNFCEVCDDVFCDICTADHARFKSTKSHKVEKIKPVEVDEVKPNCGSCQEEDKEVEAINHCGICDDFFCPDCTKIHARFKVTRNHPVTIVPTSAAPSPKLITAPLPTAPPGPTPKTSWGPLSKTPPSLIPEPPVNLPTEPPVNLLLDPPGSLLIESSAGTLAEAAIGLLPEPPVNVLPEPPVTLLPEPPIGLLTEASAGPLSEHHIDLLPESHINLLPELPVGLITGAAVGPLPNNPKTSATQESALPSPKDKDDCEFCGERVSKKSIRAHEKTEKCKNRRPGSRPATVILTASDNSKRSWEASTEDGGDDNRQAKRKHLCSPVASSSSGTRTRAGGDNC